MKMVITDELKDKILLMNGWTKERGYLLEGRGSDDYQQWFVSEGEIKQALEGGAKDSYYSETYEAMYHLEEAWETLVDDFECDCMDEDVSNYDNIEAVEKHIVQKHSSKGGEMKDG